MPLAKTSSTSSIPLVIENLIVSALYNLYNKEIKEIAQKEWCHTVHNFFFQEPPKTQSQSTQSFSLNSSFIHPLIYRYTSFPDNYHLNVNSLSKTWFNSYFKFLRSNKVTKIYCNSNFRIQSHSGQTKVSSWKALIHTKSYQTLSP